MKKLAGVLVTVSLIVFLSGCGEGREAAPDTPRCEDSKPCQTALQYLTYWDQGNFAEMYKMELDQKEEKTSSSLEDAKEDIPEDIKKVKNKQVQKYSVLEYELTKDQEYLYKFKYFQIRKPNDKEIMVLRVIKKDGSYKIDAFPQYSDVGEQFNRYYPKGLSEQEKKDLHITPIGQ